MDAFIAPHPLKIALMAGLLCMGLTASISARAAFVDDFESCSIVTLDAHVLPKVRIYAEAQPRIGDNVTHMDRLLLRSAVGYQVTPKVSLWQGYAWTPTYQNLNVDTGQFTRKFNSEQRLFQQVLVEDHWKKLAVTNRARLEERFINNAGETAIRGRHMLRLGLPLTHDGKYTLVGFDEFFLNFNATPSGAKSGFEQNRIFVGINRKITPHTSFEIGYLNSMVNVPNHSVNQMNHVVLTGLTFKF